MASSRVCWWGNSGEAFRTSQVAPLGSAAPPSRLHRCEPLSAQALLSHGLFFLARGLFGDDYTAFPLDFFSFWFHKMGQTLYQEPPPPWKKKGVQKEKVDWWSAEDLVSAPHEMQLIYPEYGPESQGEEMEERQDGVPGVVWCNLHVTQFLSLSLEGSFSFSDRRNLCNPSSGGDTGKGKDQE